MLVSEKSLLERKKRWKAPEKELTGYIKRYAQHVTSGSRGAVFKDKDTYYFVGTVPVKRYCVFL